jgi:hypothetical protein
MLRCSATPATSWPTSSPITIFVPAHERLWFESDITTHVAVEWAMDRHVAGHLFSRPADLLEAERDTLIPLMARAFQSPPENVGQALATPHPR